MPKGRTIGTMARLLPVLTLSVIATLGTLGHAQVAATGTLAGTAVDSNGEPLPGTTVTATRSAGPEETRSTVTDGLGRYQFSQLPSGTYDVTFQLEGFTRRVVEGVPIPAGMKMALTGGMTPGARDERQVVASDAISLGPVETSTHPDARRLPSANGASNDPTAADANDADIAPQRLVTVLPQYPRDAPRGTAGTVSVTLTVDATGRPFNVQPAPEHDVVGLRDVDGVLALAPEPGPAFRHAAIGAVTQWVYAPPRDDVTLLVQFTFLAEGRVRLVTHQVSSPVPANLSPALSGR